jgi:prevent-host-death family protein
LKNIPTASHRERHFMLEVDITNTSITINQLLNQVENGEEIMIISHGKPIARLSSISCIPRPLASRGELRATQTQALTSNLEIIQGLRQEARY